MAIRLSLLATAALALLSSVQVLAQEKFERIIEVQVVKESLVAHHTDQYRLPLGFAVRRGFPFQLKVTTDKLLPEDAKIMMVSENKEVDFHAVLVGQIEDTDYLVNVTTNADTPVGKYTDTFFFVSRKGDRVPKEVYEYDYPFPIYVLFNPYNEDDLAYVKEQDGLKDWIENEYGLLFTGSKDDYATFKWYYAQFEFECLEAAMKLLEDAKDTTVPHVVARHIATHLMWDEKGNPGGILEGRWAEDFPNGTNPGEWVASDTILKMWVRNDFQKVRYGQCWVFAALTTTMMRTLGLAARQLECFGSRGDSTPGLDPTHRYHHGVYFYYTPEGRMLRMEGFVWNFHSWVDVYMNRKDVDERYSGWHALDGVFPGLGPASVKAVHDLVEDHPHNSSYIISEVHATVLDVMVQCTANYTSKDSASFKWIEDHCTLNKTLRKQSEGVPLILTKAKNEWDKVEVTEDYVNKSVDAYIPFNPFPNNTYGEPVAANLVAKTHRVEVGTPVDATVNLLSPSTVHEGKRTVDLYLVAQLATYNGQYLEEIDRRVVTVVLGPSNNGQAEVFYRVDPKHYINAGNLKNRHVEVRVHGVVRETGQHLLDKTQVLLAAPDFGMRIPSRMHFMNLARPSANRAYHLELSFKNPMPVPLTQVKLTVHAKNLNIHSDEVIPFDDIPPGEEINFRREIEIPEVPGVYPVIVAFSAYNMPSMVRDVEIVVA